MGFDRRRDELLRLLDEIERIPARPVGPHLNEEDLIGLARGSINDDRETKVFEHIRSCAECAEDALNVPDVLQEAAEARERASVPAAAAAPAVDPRAVGLVWMVAATAVWVSHHQKRGIVRLSGSAADSDQHDVSSRFKCTITERGPDRFLRVRIRDEAWRERPVHCIIYVKKTGRNVAEEWVMLYAEDREGYTYGESPIHSGAPTPRQWRAKVDAKQWGAEVRVYESFDQLGDGELSTLREAFSRGALESKLGGPRALAGRAWKRWLEREVAGGRLSPNQVSAITGNEA